MKLNMFRHNQIRLPQGSIKREEEPDRSERALDRLRFVIRAPLVAQVACEVFLCRKIQHGKFGKQMMDEGLGTELCTIRFAPIAVGPVENYLGVSHVFLLFFFKKKQVRS